MAARYTTLISAAELNACLTDVLVFDCRHDLFDHAKGAAQYAAGHIPGARFVNVETELAGNKTGRNGRHPLPDRDAFAAQLRSWSVEPDSQLVVYDDAGGAMAARLWWMARWAGIETVAVLDGGVAAWVGAGFALSTGVPKPAQGRFTAGAALEEPVAVTAIEKLVAAGRSATAPVIVDARARARYAGETEPIDPKAGHIPGALNRPYADNLNPQGRFKSAVELKGEFEALLDKTPAGAVIHQCGSGITAAHNLLAMKIAGLHGSKLYAGSWSEWCSDPRHPVAIGATP